MIFACASAWYGYWLPFPILAVVFLWFRLQKCIDPKSCLSHHINRWLVRLYILLIFVLHLLWVYITFISWNATEHTPMYYYMVRPLSEPAKGWAIDLLGFYLHLISYLCIYPFLSSSLASSSTSTSTSPPPHAPENDPQSDDPTPHRRCNQRVQACEDHWDGRLFGVWVLIVLIVQLSCWASIVATWAEDHCFLNDFMDLTSSYTATHVTLTIWAIYIYGVVDLYVSYPHTDALLRYVVMIALFYNIDLGACCWVALYHYNRYRRSLPVLVDLHKD